ncbi:MAG: PQQ-dependent sugar dehydrogenase [Planctomycetes bacterium]|nr:PQQ-dependent sugar dehydrogenase [Planctomycetota bacterium]
MRSTLLLLAPFALAAVARAQNQAPLAPRISEPTANWVNVHPQDVHMETLGFQDPNPGDTHTATDWELVQLSNAVRVWSFLSAGTTHLQHVHLGDGVFEGPLAGWATLDEEVGYRLRVRHRDASGDPATEWSPWSERSFYTTRATGNTALELGDIAAVPAPSWSDDQGAAIDLPFYGPTTAEMRLEAATGPLLLRIQAQSASGNAVTNPPAITAHIPLRIVIESGSQALALPPSVLRVAEAGCDVHRILLPAINLAAGARSDYWVSLQGTTYLGSANQTAPSWSLLARGPRVPWLAREVGYEVEEVAGGLRLPVNLAFHPNAENAGPLDPFVYVTELYGTIKTVLKNGTVLDYATNLLNYVPNGAFPGAGEQGLTGIAVDPASGDLFVSRLSFVAASGSHEPSIVRLSSIDGGRTSISRSVVLNMPGESQAQSHQISNLEIVGGRLFAHMGDGFVTATALNLDSFRGKVLCLELSGAASSTNPFYNAANGITARDYIYAYGLRNPFGGGYRAADGFRYEVENGPTVDRFARVEPGANYGFDGTDASMAIRAIFNWSPAMAPVNVVFVQPSTFGGSGFPASKQDRAFVSESGPTYASGTQTRGKAISEFAMDLNGNRLAGPIPFVEYVGTGHATAVGLAAGPDGLYFTELYRDAGGAGPTATGARLLRVRFTAADDCDGNGLSDACEIAVGTQPDCNGNSFPDACDLSSGRARDFDANGRPDSCDPLEADRDEISTATGGQVAFSLHPDLAYANRPYLLVGSASGTQPGTPLGSVVLPLNVIGDLWFQITLSFPNSALLTTSFANLDGAARGNAALVVPPALGPQFLGLELHHAYVLFDPAAGFAIDFASNGMPLRLVL